MADADGDRVDVLGGGGRLHPGEVAAALDPVGGGREGLRAAAGERLVRGREHRRRRAPGGDLVGLAGPADGHHRAACLQPVAEGGGDQCREQPDPPVGPPSEPLGAEQQRDPRRQPGGGRPPGHLEHAVGADGHRDQVGAVEGGGQAAGVVQPDPGVDRDPGPGVGAAGPQLGQEVVVQPGPPEPHPVTGGHRRSGQGAAHGPGSQDGNGGHVDLLPRHSLATAVQSRATRSR